MVREKTETAQYNEKGEILDKHGKPVRLTEMTTAGG